MNATKHTNISEIIQTVPECREFLHPYLSQINDSSNLEMLAANNNISVSSLISGLERYIKRATQNLCDYQQMRELLIKTNSVNIAGFVNFLWQEPFINELKNKAEEIGINININIFPKHLKKVFQNYLAVCNNPDDLPEILIGKGFSSFMTSHFVDTFVKPGYYQNPIAENKMSDFFKNKSFTDSYQSYHPFGVEELVMVYDTSYSDTVSPPKSWEDILKPEYKGRLSQMGKEQQDHFGFIMMLYLHDKLNSEGIKRFAENVKIKQHFTHTIKNIGKQNERSSPVNIMHQFASKFIRSEARETVRIIDALDGNPSVCHFFLLKKSASENAIEIANHLYSGQIKTIIEKAGTTHISTSIPTSDNQNIRWIGWDTLRELPLPYMKEQLSEIAYKHFNV